jgi:hypothetical protein
MSPNFMEKASIALSSMAGRMIGEVMLDKGVKRPQARAIIAREAGISPGSLESLSRGRLKYTDRIASKLNALRIRKLEEHMLLLQHELAIAKTMDAHSKVDLTKAEVALADARKALGK